MYVVNAERWVAFRKENSGKCVWEIKIGVKRTYKEIKEVCLNRWSLEWDVLTFRIPNLNSFTISDSTNRDSLDAIERSIFVLCLDKGIPISFNHQNSIDETNRHIRDDVSLAFQMLHGMGTNHNSANRWYDKTMQFIISQDGACGLNYEHSPSEGIAVVQLIEHLLKYM